MAAEPVGGRVTHINLYDQAWRFYSLAKGVMAVQYHPEAALTA
jgi:carbamoylphosphate synthase small subunit